jgi:predicted NAD-dependent protein-ADP-ribosyltransferase YbiA (DUF1768 family)
MANPLPFIVVSGVKVAPFKHFGKKPYGPLVNTSPLGVHAINQSVNIHGQQLNFNWPSSEQAFHAQKFLRLKTKYAANHPMQGVIDQALHAIEIVKPKNGKTFLPRDDFDPIKNWLASQLGTDMLTLDRWSDSDYHSMHNPQGGLDYSKNPPEPFTRQFMKDVIRMKLEQHADLKQLAMDMAEQGILPIEVSRFDMNWASGENGLGKNMLGEIILELGNEYVLAKNPHYQLPIPNPKWTYEQLQRTHAHLIAHDNLDKGIDVIHKNNHYIPSKSSTSSATSTGSTPLNTWFDNARQHRVVERRRGADLQLHFYPNGQLKGVLYRINANSPWQKGNINFPAAQRLYQDYLSQQKATTHADVPPNKPITTPPSIPDVVPPSKSPSSKGVDTQPHLKKLSPAELLMQIGFDDCMVQFDILRVNLEDKDKPRASALKDFTDKIKEAKANWVGDRSSDAKKFIDQCDEALKQAQKSPLQNFSEWNILARSFMNAVNWIAAVFQWEPVFKSSEYSQVRLFSEKVKAMNSENNLDAEKPSP